MRPSTRSAPKAAASSSFFSGPFWIESVTPKCACRSAASAASVPGVLVATISAPAPPRAAGSRSVCTGYGELGQAADGEPVLLEVRRAGPARQHRHRVAGPREVRAHDRAHGARAQDREIELRPWRRCAVRPSERLGDVLHQPAVLRLGLGRIALEHAAVAADEELLEVPADVAGDAAVGGGQEPYTGCRAGPFTSSFSLIGKVTS